MKLIDGVEILSKSKDYDFVALGIMVLIIAIGFLAFSLFVFFQRDYGFGGILMVVAIICLSLSLLLFFLPKITIYKVTIDKSVTMEEFNQHYDIINQEGKIYTIKVKEKK